MNSKEFDPINILLKEFSKSILDKIIEDGKQTPEDKDSSFEKETCNSGNIIEKIPDSRVTEYEDRIEADIFIPGAKKENIVIEINEGIVNVSAEISAVTNSENGNVIYNDLTYQKYVIEFKIPEKIIDTENIKAEYRDGVLKLIFKKKEKKARKIEIN